MLVKDLFTSIMGTGIGGGLRIMSKKSMWSISFSTPVLVLIPVAVGITMWGSCLHNFSSFHCGLTLLEL